MSAGVLWSVAFVLLGAAPAAGAYFPPADPRAGGIRDLMLIYLSKDSWSPDDFLPYVAYLGKESPPKPRDWFYDSFLFLAYGGAPSGTTYIDGPSNKADWEYYLDQLLFREGRSLTALEACIAHVEQTLGPRPKVPVILMIPYPSRRKRTSATWTATHGAKICRSRPIARRSCGGVSARCSVAGSRPASPTSPCGASIG